MYAEEDSAVVVVVPPFLAGPNQQDDAGRHFTKLEDRSAAGVVPQWK